MGSELNAITDAIMQERIAAKESLARLALEQAGGDVRRVVLLEKPDYAEGKFEWRYDVTDAPGVADALAAVRAELAEEKEKCKAFAEGQRYQCARAESAESARDALQAKLDSTQSAATSWEESARKYHDDYLEVREISHKRMVEINALQAKLAEAERERDEALDQRDAALEALEDIRDAGEIGEPAHDRAVMGLVSAHLASPAPESPLLMACSVRGDTVHARRPGERVALCGEKNVNVVEDSFDASSVSWNCKRCMKLIEPQPGPAEGGAS